MEKEVATSKLELDKNPEVDQGPSLVVADGNVQTTCLVQVSTAKTVESSDDRVVRV